MPSFFKEFIQNIYGFLSQKGLFLKYWWWKGFYRFQLPHNFHYCSTLIMILKLTWLFFNAHLVHSNQIPWKNYLLQPLPQQCEMSTSPDPQNTSFVQYSFQPDIFRTHVTRLILAVNRFCGKTRTYQTFIYKNYVQKSSVQCFSFVCVKIAYV